MFSVDPDYFMTKIPFIDGNPNLREPQVLAYQRVQDHFLIEKSTEHAQIILPTGTGKTGLMGIIPYGLCNKRCLIITPQLVIKDAVLGSLDPDYERNFWIMTQVFDERGDLPSVIEYETHHEKDLLQYANIVILNVHKLQKRLKSTLLSKVPEDFFDLIIIDEAHHAEAKTWKDAIDYFKKAKVVKVTGTPFRSDGKALEGKIVYEYKLREAMERGYVKTLERIEHIPNQLMLTIDEDEDMLYTVEEIRSLGLKEEDWINRSVALSKDSNRVIVDKSLEILEEKLEVSDFPHKIIAVACSIWHAEQVKKLYEARGYEVALVHHRLDKVARAKEMDRIEKNEVKVVVNVSILGEGYDHKFLSIAAIFRPYKHELPYAQFIGRVLRAIPYEEGKLLRPDDNIAAVVYHKELGLEPLWKFYKDEIRKRDIIGQIKGDPKLPPNEDTQPNPKYYGQVQESGSNIEIDTFIATEMIAKRLERQAEEENKIKQMMDLLKVSREQAVQFIKQSERSNNKDRLLRPDLYVDRTRKHIDKKIKFEIVPDLLVEYGLLPEGNEVSRVTLLFQGKYRWIKERFNTNSELLAILLENRLNEAIGAKRDQWKMEDWPKAEKELEKIVGYLRKSLDRSFRR